MYSGCRGGGGGGGGRRSTSQLLMLHPNLPKTQISYFQRGWGGVLGQLPTFSCWVQICLKPIFPMCVCVCVCVGGGGVMLWLCQTSGEILGWTKKIYNSFLDSVVCECITDGLLTETKNYRQKADSCPKYCKSIKDDCLVKCYVCSESNYCEVLIMTDDSVNAHSCM